MEPDQVKYLPVPDFPGYRVGNDGTVWSQWKQVRRGPNGFESLIFGDWRRLVGTHVGKDRNYHAVLLKRNGKAFSPKVARLVLTAFVGPCPDGMECCHSDGNSLNNRLENLRWDTSKSNWADRKKHGTALIGIKHPRAKLNEQQVRIIRHIGPRATQRYLAVLFGVEKTTIKAIINRTNWRCLA